MIRLSGVSLVVLIVAGMLTGVMLADMAESPEDATLEIDDDAQMYVGGEAIGDPMTTAEGTPITQLDSAETPIADHPANVIEWSPYRVQSSLIGVILSALAVTATATAQFILASGIPVEWWVGAVEVGAPLAMVAYTAMHLRRVRRGVRI